MMTKNLTLKKQLQFLLFTLIGLACTSTSFGQTALFDEEVTNPAFSSLENNIRTTYDAREIRFVRFDGLKRDLSLQLNLFGNIKSTASYLRTDNFTNGTSAWVGKIDGEPTSSIVFAESNGTWAGRMQDASGNRYLLVATSEKNVYALVELGDDNLNEGNDAVIRPIEQGVQGATPRNAVGICDVGSTCADKTVDILIVYTAAVTANQGGTAAVNASFAAIIADMNTINANSGVTHTFNLIHTYETNYVETTNSSTDLNWLEADATSLALRDAHGADIVGLITNTATSDYCGLGNLNNNPTNYSSDAAFSVSAWGCAGSNRTFAHEVGHNMGLRHDRFVDNENTPCVQAHGYVNQAAFGSTDVTKRWRTVMAYNNQCSSSGGFNCSRLAYWSNPNNTNTGDPMGSTTSGSEADAAYLITRSICMIAEFKAAPICPDAGTLDGADFICSGGLTNEISTWQTNVTNFSINFAAISSSNTSSAVEYSTALVSGAVASPNGSVATGVHSGGAALTETQTTYAYLRCFGADGVMGGSDDTYLLLGTHTLTVDSPATGTGNGMTSVSVSSCASSQNISLTTNATSLEENGVIGWWITEGSAISATVTDDASLSTAVGNTTIGGTLSNTVDNLFESTSGSPKKNFTLPFDCSTLDNTKTYYATPVVGKSKTAIADLMCNDLQGNGSQINFNGGTNDGSGATVDFSSCSTPTSSNPVTFTLTVNLTSYTETLPSSLAILIRNTANSNLIFTSNSIASLPTVLTYTETDFPTGYDPRVDGMKIFFINFNSAYTAGSPTIEFNYDLDMTYPGETGITFPGVTTYNDCLFGSPVQISCSCATTCPTIGTLAGTTPICSGDNTTTLTASGLADIGTNDIKFVYFTSPQTGAAVYGTPTGTLGTVTNATIGTGTTAALSNVTYPTAGDDYYVYAILSPTPTDAGCRPSATTTITVNDVPVIASTKTDPTTCSGTDGIIKITGLKATTEYTLNYKKAGAAVAAATITSTSASEYEITGLDAAAYTEITVTETSTGCTSNQTAQTLVDPTAPTVSDPSDQTVCVGAMTTAVTFSGTTGATYEWVNDNTMIGLTGSGTGDIAAFTTTNSTTGPITANITVTPKKDGCSGTAQTFVITVNPLPAIASTKTDPTTCSGTDGIIKITGLKASTSYTLNYKKAGAAVAATTITSSSASEYEITGLDAATYTEITVTETATGCVSNQTAQTLADPSAPTVTDPSDQTVCVATMTTAVTFSGTSGATFEWANDNTAIGLAAAGVGDIPAFTGTNATASSIIATITVTPKMGACTGTAQTFTITVNPLPAIASTKTDPTTCGGTDGIIKITGLKASTGYTLSYKKAGIAVAAATITSTSASEYEITGLNAAAYTEITVTETATGCTSNQTAQTLLDPSAPTVSDPNDQAVCVGAMTAAVTFSGTTGATFEWTNDNTAIGLAASGTGNITAFTTTNTTASPIVSTITVTPKLGACSGTAQTFTITVNPLPAIASTKTDPTTCGGTDGKIKITGLKASTGYTLNYKKAGTAVTAATITSTSASEYEITGLDAAAYTEITVTETATGCVSNQTAQTLADPSAPTVADPSDQAVCVATMTTAVTFSGTSGATFEWANDNAAIGLAASGVGNIPAFTGTNATASPIIATITVTPKMGACTGTAQTFTITVNPLPAIASTKTNPTTCSGTDGKIKLTGLKVSTGYTLNYKKAGTAVATATITSTAGGEHEITGLDAAAYTEITVTETTTGCTSNQTTQTLSDPGGVTAATLASPAVVCNGQSTNLTVTITGGTSPYGIVYSDGTTNATVNSNTSVTTIPVSPTATTNYNLVSITDVSGCAGTGLTGTPTISIATISAISIGNISSCNNNGTDGVDTDDTFTADVTVTFANPPSTGNLELSGSGMATVATSSLSGTSHTFTGVSMPSNGGTIALSANFSTLTGCTFNNSNAGTAPSQCSTTFTDINGTGGNMGMFMAEDPCSCNGDQVLNTNGSVATIGSFSETVTVRGPSNLFLRIPSNAATTGLLDGTRNSIAFPAMMVENVVGGGLSDYTITFNHLDRMGYSIAQFEFANTLGGTYSTITTPSFDVITISNLCAYPKMVFNPTLASEIGSQDAPITLGANLVGTNPTFTPLGAPTFTVNNVAATVFTPQANIGVNTIQATYDIVAGSGAGGTSAAPATPLDLDGNAATGVCPISIQAAVVVSDGVIPTMSQWGLLIFGLLLLNLSLILILRYQTYLKD